MTTIKFRRDTSVNWTSVNPIPAQGEPCYETDTGKLKIGNGSDNYVALPYVSDGGGSSGNLPIATATTLGGIKVGNNLSITEDGTLSANGGSTGTTDYTQLENKPQINSVELTGNKTLDDLGIQAKGDYLTALPDNAVTTDTAQEITGDKTFTGSITTANITCNNTLMASTIRTKANGTIKLAHPTNNASGMITLDNNYGQLSITNGLSGNNNLLQVVNGTAYATLMGNKIETKDKDGNLYHYINSKNITNCLLEVPQRIKLELNDGTLTLKAGSQVIVPNGFEADGITPKFDYVDIESDIAINSVNANGECTLYYNQTEGGLSFYYTNTNSSGTTPPMRDGTFYNTANNIINRYTNGSAITQLSLPLATIIDGTSTITSIDQVFNGMGYIGSTVWVDKGVKGLIPNGRNEDGSLNNVEFETSRVLTHTNTNNLNSVHWIICNDSKIEEWDSVSWIGYNEEKNIIYNKNGSASSKDGNQIACSVIAYMNHDGTELITSFQPKLPFRAVDYNDKSEISGWGMPSNRYIDLTFGTSGSKYTIPTNGYVYVSGNAKAVNARIELVTSNLSTKCISPMKTTSLSIFIPVMKGDVVSIFYENTDIITIRFVYAEGSK